VNGGYTQKDVQEVARCFTGWTFREIYSDSPDMGRFRFQMSHHDQRAKRVMGTKIRAGGGEEDGLAVLSLLAHHPKTADFMSWKLLRFFHGYAPDKSTLKRVRRKFESSGGDIRATLKTVLSKKSMKKATPKLKRPQHLMISAIRATSADVDDIGFLIEKLEEAGHFPFAWSAPNGYPDTEAYWSGFILPRWNFAASVASPDESTIRVDPFFLDDSLSPGRLVQRIDDRIFDGRMTAETRIGIEEFLGTGKLNAKRIREAIGLAIASPEFQSF
jgi:uncharacterized protein (DUF1800 family)